MSDTANKILNENLLIVHEAFPRIGAAIDLYWGNKELPVYINGLIVDTTPNRQGFPGGVLFALIVLQELHDKAFPEYAIVSDDDWMSSQFNIH